VAGFDIDLILALAQKDPPPEESLPLGEWHDHNGNWRLPYAAGVSGDIRLIYLPYSRFRDYPVPTIHGLEEGVKYRAYYWEPTLGTKFELGIIEGVKGGHGVADIKAITRELYDSRGKFRGQLQGSVWGSFGTHQRIVRDTYQPEPPPIEEDWLLVLEAQK